MQKASPLMVGGFVAIVMASINFTRVKGPATFAVCVLFLVLGIGLIVFGWIRQSRS